MTRRRVWKIGILIATTLYWLRTPAEDTPSTTTEIRTEVAHKVATLPDTGQLSVTISADASKVVTADIGQDSLRVWTWRQGAPTNHLLVMPAHSELSRANIAVAFSPNGRYLAATHLATLPDKTKAFSESNSSCRAIQIWDAQTEKPVVDLDDFQTGCIASGVAFSNAGDLLFAIENGPQLCSGYAEHVVVFSTSNWKRLWNICVDGSGIGQLAVSRDDKFVAIGGSRDIKVDRTARPDAPEFESREVVAIVDLHTRHTVRLIDQALPDQFDIEALAWSPDGRRLAVGGGNRRGDSRPDALKIYDPKSGQLMFNENSPYSDIKGLAYTSDGKYFIEAVTNKEVQIWDGSHGHLLQVFPTGWGSVFEDLFNALAVSSDNHYLAVTQQNGTTVYELK